MLLLTATPHHGDDDRFAHFIRLIDSDLFPDRTGWKPGNRDPPRHPELGHDCPWALRRLKEDLRDLRGRRLFPDRHAHTVAFKLNVQEYDLYKAVTAYINEFLPQASGRRQASVALARTVLQRRLASSTMAIHESIRRRLERQQTLLEELEDLTPAQRARRLAQLQGRLDDGEQDEDDLDDAERDQLADQFTSAARPRPTADGNRRPPELLAQARQVRDQRADSKLNALKSCLEKGRVQGTQRRARQAAHLHRAPRHAQLPLRIARPVGILHLPDSWRDEPARTQARPGAIPPEKQICVATEAAGEGINLQFCQLMINYDLPWNPTRLGAAARPHPPHRPGARRPRLQFRRPALPRRGSPSSRAASWSGFSKSSNRCGPSSMTASSM